MARQLQSIDLVSPGSLGLNFSQASNLLSPQYCIEAKNAVIDSSGRLAARRGYEDLTTTDITANPAVESLHEYVQKDATTEMIVAWDGGIANDVADPEGNDISGVVTDTNGSWWFQNFNDKCLGFQAGQKMIVYTGAGTFATVSESAGTAPSTGIAVAAFGRVWQLGADGNTIYYSGLLDETDWAGTGSGSIDMAKVWTSGQDTIQAIAAFNGALVVFGLNHIIFWVDGKGSELGLDPVNMYVADIISGTGCVDQQTVQNVGETDLIFLAPAGIQSLARVIQEKSNPIKTLSKKASDTILTQVSLETTFRSAYSSLHQMYLLTLVDSGITWVLDQRRRYQDEDGDELSALTRWDLAPHSWATLRDKSLYLGNSFGVGKYTGTLDGTANIPFIWESPWMDLGEDYANLLKIIKRLGFVLLANTDSTIVFKWYTDFKPSFKTLQKTLAYSAPAEWGSGEWNTSQWSAGIALTIIKLPARGKGQYIKLALESSLDGDLAIQQAELFAKLGRIA